MAGPSSSAAEPSTSTAGLPTATEELSMPRDESENVEMEIDETILSLLGDAPKPETLMGKNIHEAISSRWLEVLSKGLDKDTKEKMQKTYLVPGNCELLVAPILNPEAKVAMTDFMIKRDQSLLQKQQQLGTALAALGQATELLISKEATEKVLKPLSDACRLLCDNHFQDTKTRRNFVVSSVKPDLKETLINTTRNKLLFGDKLTDELKCAQNIQKSGEGLKVTPKQPFNKKQFIKNNNGNNNGPKNRLNYKPLPRQAPRAEAGRYQQTQRPATRNSRPQHQNQYQQQYQYQGRARSPARKTSYRR